MSEYDTHKLIISSVLSYIVYAINKCIRDNLVTVLDAPFTVEEVSDARDVISPVGGVELLGEGLGRNDSSKRSRRHALCYDIYDAMRKMDVADVRCPHMSLILLVVEGYPNIVLRTSMLSQWTNASVTWRSIV